MFTVKESFFESIDIHTVLCWWSGFRTHKKYHSASWFNLYKCRNFHHWKQDRKTRNSIYKFRWRNLFFNQKWGTGPCFPYSLKFWCCKKSLWLFCARYLQLTSVDCKGLTTACGPASLCVHASIHHYSYSFKSGWTMCWITHAVAPMATIRTKLKMELL